MEVHHHPHVEKKNFKEYFLEFLMIFLAVTMGFFAENVREHISDRAKEREYITSFIEDLKNDTATLHQEIPKMKQSIKGLDTLINQTYLYIKGNADTRLMYYTYHHDCRGVFNLQLSQRTINQLKNSGNMRLIQDEKAANIISSMEVGFESLRESTRFYLTRQEDAAAFGLKIFDFEEYKKANTKKDGTLSTNDEGFLALTYQPPLNNTDTAYLKEFSARVGYFRNAFDVYVSKLDLAIPEVEASIAYLKKNYHL